MLKNAVARLSRAFSTGPLDSKTFSDTLFLPKTKFPLRPDPTQNEALYRTRTSEELYRWQRKHITGPEFVLHDGPPYANGDLHMGHALNKILKDIINRFALLRGRKVQNGNQVLSSYIPGWDCHGLPIENKALQELKQDLSAVPPSTIRAAARSVATREVASQKAQFRQFGIMADWDSDDTTYRTLDHSYEIRQLRIFETMVYNGLIHRRYRPVHYSPSSRSALAEAELVYKDNHSSNSVYVKFELDEHSSQKVLGKHTDVRKTENIQLIVWTTTPWTLTANMGIAVHNDMTYSLLRRAQDDSLILIAQSRLEALQDILGSTRWISDIQGADLIGLGYEPIFSSIHPNSLKGIISSSHVTSDSGTGLVHCAPAHGDEDYKLFREKGLIDSGQNSGRAESGMVCHVHEGRFSEKVAEVVGPDMARQLVGQPVLEEGNRTVIKYLEQAGRLVATKRYMHRYPYDWKTDKPIIVTATSQWFANLDRIKGAALEALKAVQFYPEQSRNRLESFIKSRSEWCISRQRVWGVPIPALINMETGDAVLTQESLRHILGVLEQKGVQHWLEGPIEDFIRPGMKPEEWTRSTDTMDVWFDSGTSWSMLDVPSRNGRSNGQMYVWKAQISIGDGSTSVVDSDAVANALSPYGTLITHGMVLDEQGKKMSKSLGNIVSPLTIVLGGSDKKKDPAYGADLLRLWAASVEYKNDMSIGRTSLAQTAEAMRKIRNSARFILGNIGDGDALREFERVERKDMGLVERFVMHELCVLESTALAGFGAYDFAKVTTSLINFANVTLSSFYFDITKDVLYANSFESVDRRAVVTVLEKILGTMMSILAPMLPHLAEEIHAHLPRPTHEPEWEDFDAANNMRSLLRVRKSVLALLEQARGDKRMKSALEAQVDIIIPDDAMEHPLIELLRREENILKTIFITSDATLIDEGSLGNGSQSLDWVYSESLELGEGLGMIAWGYVSDLPLWQNVHGAGHMQSPKGKTYVGDVKKCYIRHSVFILE
ncbi:hypothetical protein D9757_003845 [Collybiopsis confluens]|uniref:isoleucine--tRNA ligase n=1 Tax=Collybiopsis confluens TaxID=2823264 RepID=A0A8H5HV18_9AGAR|nr:hypothetical protein D9757_003845 [Collybiopsis confluens]